MLATTVPSLQSVLFDRGTRQKCGARKVLSVILAIVNEERQELRIAEMGDRAKAKWAEKWGGAAVLPWDRSWVPI